MGEGFIALSELGHALAGVMSAHIVYSELDTKPASFSSYWLQSVLRNRLKFQGAVFSDDLGMAGANYAGDFISRALSALSAGCDMVVICNNQHQAIAVVEGLKYDVKTSSQSRIAAFGARA